MRNSITYNGRRGPLWNWMNDFDGFFNNAWETPVVRTTSYDVDESEAGYLMTLDLPGVRKEDLKVEAVDRILTVSGERKHLAKQAEEGRKFLWRFSVPVNVDSNKVEAHLDNGVLQIALPKAEATKARSIEIQSRSSAQIG